MFLKIFFILIDFFLEKINIKKCSNIKSNEKLLNNFIIYMDNKKNIKNNILLIKIKRLNKRKIK